MRDDKYAVIVAAGDFPTAEQALGQLRGADYVVCCDGGADQYIAQGSLPDAIVGDGDSLSELNRKRYASIVHHNPDQQTNDQTKAVEFLMERGYRNISIVAATGRREDHTIGNIALLVEYMRWGANVKIYTDYGVFIPCRDTQTLPSYIGERVSIFNFTARGLRSEGLEYPIYDFTSWWQGTLNCSVASQFTIYAEGEYILFKGY